MSSVQQHRFWSNCTGIMGVCCSRRGCRASCDTCGAFYVCGRTKVDHRAHYCTRCITTWWNTGDIQRSTWRRWKRAQEVSYDTWEIITESPEEAEHTDQAPVS